MGVIFYLRILDFPIIKVENHKFFEILLNKIITITMNLSVFGFDENSNQKIL